MEQLILIVHVLIALGIIALILLQQGKGADAGASFGSGSSNTVFGSQGGGNVLTKATGLLATLFFATSLTLAMVAKDKVQQAAVIDLPTVVESQEFPEASVEGDIPAGIDIPVFDSAVQDQTGDIPE